MINDLTKISLLMTFVLFSSFYSLCTCDYEIFMLLLRRSMHYKSDDVGENDVIAFIWPAIEHVLYMKAQELPLLAL